jgi:enoyl-CoA hydratase/carnithine racemase
VICREDDGGIVRLIIDRPDRRNAFDNATAAALGDALDAVAAERACRVLVIKGAGDIFSAGRDLKAEAEGEPTRAEIIERDGNWARIFQTLHRLPAPSVAVVRGYAVAGGFTLAMGCDFVLAERDAKFGALEMKNGFPASVCTPILARLTGRRMALELALFGDLVEATRLYEMGLVSRLADGPEELAEIEADFVGRLAALDPHAVALTREMFRAAETMPLDNALDMGKHLNSFLSASGWFAEGGRKFAAQKKDG